MLHGIHYIQSESIAPRCMESTAFNRYSLSHDAWNPLHSITHHGIHHIQSCCMESIAFNRDPLCKLHGIHCIQSCCMESNAFNWDALNHAAWKSLHSIGMLWAMLHKIHCIPSGCIGPCCMDSTANNRDPLRHNAGIFCIH